MKGNSQLLLSPRMYMGDIDGDGIDELIEIDGRHIYVFKCHGDHAPVLEHAFASKVKRLIIGDFVSSGREKGKDQIFALLEDGSIQGWAISDDKKEMWWWFTQPNFIADSEHFIVGDFDGDAADEILVYNPSTGVIKIHERKSNGLLGEMSGYNLGNLRDHDLKNKLLIAGNFGQAANRKDLLVLNRSNGVVMRFDTATDTAGVKTFWWAFTSNNSRFKSTDEVIVANTDNDVKDDLIVRDGTTGQYKIFQLEFNNGNLLPNTSIDIGQLPIKPKTGRIMAAKVREAHLRNENGKLRDDIVYFDDSKCEIIRTDARLDAPKNKFTYWWAYSSTIVVEPVKAAQNKPWAVMLCRFKGMPGNAAIEKLFREAFTPGAGGLIEYWHDVSLGSVDVGNTKVFSWIELQLERKDCALPRAQLIDAAISATKKAGFDPITGFHKQLAVFTHDFSKDGAPPGASWATPGWAAFWLDGSADGNGRVSAPPHGHNGSFLAHEMGHGFGFDHDLGADLVTNYGDLNCIMSAMAIHSFQHPKWNVPFGPTMSFPQLANKNWSLPRRTLTLPKTWVTAGTSFRLAPMSDRKIDANIGVVLPNSTGSWDYYLEYQRPIGWNRGIPKPRLVIRRRSGNTGAWLGIVDVPNNLGGKASFTEPSGKVKFEVEKIRADERMINVKVTKVP